MQRTVTGSIKTLILRYMDLSGAGGLSLGLEKNGFNHALSVDFDKDSVDLQI